MPYVSRKQQAAMHAKVERGEIPVKVVEEFDDWPINRSDDAPQELNAWPAPAAPLLRLSWWKRARIAIASRLLRDLSHVNLRQIADENEQRAARESARRFGNDPRDGEFYAYEPEYEGAGGTSIMTAINHLWWYGRADRRAKKINPMTEPK